MPFVRSLYNTFFRRTSTYVLTIVVGAVFFERMFDQGIDSIWYKINRGVSFCARAHHNCYASVSIYSLFPQKLWKDIKHEYEGGDEGGDGGDE